MKIRKSINSAKGYWADDLNAENNKKILQTLANSLYDEFADSSIIAVDDIIRSTATEGAYALNIYIDPPNYEDEKHIRIISTADGRGKFICRVYDSDMNLIEEDTISMSGCKQAVINKIDDLISTIDLKSNGIGSSMKIRKNRVTANKRRSVKSACGKKAIKATYDDGMYSDIELSKDAYIDEWQRDYSGTPNTSWDNIFDNVLNEFTLYCGDEASAYVDDYYNYSDPLEIMYADGQVDAEEVAHEFDQWLMWRDISEFDF